GDPGQRWASGDVPERVWQGRVAAAVVERVTGLVQEGLVIVEPALGARDQVHDGRRIRRNHAGARRLLRPVVEIEADVRLVLEVEAELLDRVHADLDGTILRVRRFERRETAQVRDVVRGRNLCALGAE